MKLNLTESPITRKERLKIKENWMMIQDDFNNVVSKISDEAFQEVVDNAKLNWLPEYVDTYEDIATIYPNPEEGDTTMARHASADFPTDPDDKRDAGVVWRFDGTEWQPIQQIDVSAFNQAFDDLNKEIGSVQSNLTGHETDLDNPHQVNPDQIGANHSQVFDIRSYDNDIQSALTACYNAGGGTVFVPDGLYEITETLEIYANTHLLLSHNAVLKCLLLNIH
nr:hypothetical protein JUJ52_18785 [Virgibacillus sp. AGTR]